MFILSRIICNTFNVSQIICYVVITLPFEDGIHVSNRQMSQYIVLWAFVYFISHYNLLFLPIPQLY